MPKYGHDLIQIQPPVNRQLEESSSWINMLHGIDIDLPKGWVQVGVIPIVNSDQAKQENRSWTQISDQAAA